MGLHHPSRYTIYGTQLVDQLIQRDLRHGVHMICERWPDQQLAAIVLCGGYGRGEGGVQRKNSQEYPFDDYDLLVVFKSLKPKEQAQINLSLGRLAMQISEKTAVPVDIAPVVDLETLSRAPFTLFWYLIRHSHRVLWGQVDLMQTLPTFPVEQLAADEGYKLLLNRGIELWRAIDAGFPLVDPWIDPRWQSLLLALHNAIIALGDAVMIFRGCYHPIYQERIAILKSLLQHEQDLPDAHMLAYLYPEAIQYKLSPYEYRNLPVELVIGKLEVVRQLFLTYLQAFLAQTFAWEKAEIHSFQAWLRFLLAHPPSLVKRFQNMRLNLQQLGRQIGMNGWLWHPPQLRYLVSLPYLLDPEHFQPGPECLGLFPELGPEPSTAALGEAVKSRWKILL